MAYRLVSLLVGCVLIALVSTGARAGSLSTMRGLGDVLRYAPTLVFHADECYFPISLYGDDSAVWNNHENYDADVLNKGLVAIGANRGKEAWDADNTGFPDTYVCYYHIQRARIVYPLSWAGCYEVIQYWYYYAYNPPWSGLTVTAHEHDFEVVSVWVDCCTGQVARITASEHLWHTVASFPPLPLIVYVARGGHGMTFSRGRNFKSGLELEPHDFVFLPLASLAEVGAGNLDVCGHLRSGGGGEFTSDRSFFLEQGRVPWLQARYRSPAVSADETGILCIGDRYASYEGSNPDCCRLVGGSGLLQRQLCPRMHTPRIIAGTVEPTLVYRLLVSFAGAQGDSSYKSCPAPLRPKLSCMYDGTDEWAFHGGSVVGWGLAMGICRGDERFCLSPDGCCTHGGRGDGVSALTIALGQVHSRGLALGGMIHFVSCRRAGEEAQVRDWEVGLLYEDLKYELACTAGSRREEYSGFISNGEHGSSLRVAGAWHTGIGEVADLRLGARASKPYGDLPLFNIDARLWWYGFLSLQAGYEWRSGGPASPACAVGMRVGDTNLTLATGTEQGGGYWYYLTLECRI